MRTLNTILLLGVLIISGNSIAQSGGMLKGTVLDEKNLPMPFAPVAVLHDSVVIASTQTDVNGEFTMKELTPGKYSVKAVYASYNSFLLEKVTINPNQVRYVTINMVIAATGLPPVIITGTFREPAFNPDFSTVTSITVDQIENSPLKNDIIGMITTVPGIIATPDGNDIYVRGSRRGSTAYYVDGLRTMGIPEIPGIGIGGMEVLTGGVPAMYGDCTGGMVIITTKEYKWEMSRKQNEIDDRKEKETAARNAIKEQPLFTE